MAKDGFKVMDSDMHVMEPPDLWERYIDREFKTLCPRGLTEGVRDLRIVGVDGKPWGMPVVEDRPHRPPGRVYEATEKLFRPYSERGWTGEVQLGAMDEEGIDVAVLYPSRGLHALSKADLDPRLAAALARAYNNWLYDFCHADPARLLGAGMISPFAIDDAVAEARRCATELGFKAVFVRANVANGRNWHDPYYEPLWTTLEELNIPLGFHESAASAVRQVGDQFGSNFMLRHLFSHPVELMLAAGSMCGAGVLQRHPRLRVAFLEGNCSWLPWFLWRLDEHWEMFGDVWAPELRMLPSGYFKRQCFASVEPDETPVKYVVEHMGSDRLVFSTDFPHIDTRFPHAVDELLKLPLSDEDKRKILWDNCASYYGL
ncbi:MAG: amidohydrolase [Deltaproteobacteria bacterium]|nr:amidohydrolase [Deltaproteobacteria bacterium]